MENYNEDEITQQLQDPTTQRKAFEEVVKQYSQQLYWQIRRMVLSHEDANDIALNECLNFLNKQRAQNQLSLDDVDTALLGKLESDPYFDGDEIQKEFQKALLQLPEKQRIIFNLKYFKEMKYENISEILGTSVGALKASYHHAVKKIAAFFEETD